MAAVVTGTTRDGREGSASRSNFDLRDEVTLTDVYWVETNDANDNADVAMLAAGVPRLGDIHPRINSLRVSRVSAQNVSGRTDRWKVPVLYEQEPAEEPDVDIDFEIHRVPIVGGAQLIAGPMGTATPAPAGGVPGAGGALNWQGVANWGVPILNSAGEAFVPVPEDEEAYLVVKIARNEFVRSLNDIKKYNNSLNAKPFLGGAERTWLMMVRGRPITNSIQHRWRIEYVCKFNKLTWDVRLLDHGRYYRAVPGVPPAGALIPFTDDHKDNVLGNLDGKGGALAAGLPPNWIRLVRKEVLDWTPLGLEATINSLYSPPAPGPKPDPLMKRAARNAGIPQNLVGRGFGQ